MGRMNMRLKLRIALCAATSLVAFPVLAETPVKAAAPSLEEGFKDPPNSARPRVWWHWMNGNITKDGIAKDFAWMKRVGIGGMQNFDANLQTPQIVDKRLVYMTPEWKDAFKFAATEADRLGMELTIAASPGWSETGGPWVPPEDGLKKLVWSETTIAGGKPFKGKLAAPPSTTGPFQSIGPSPSIEEMMGVPKTKEAAPQHYGDVRVLAIPVSAAADLAPVAVKDAISGKALDGGKLADADFNTGVDIGRGDGKTNPLLVLDYGKPVTARSVSLFSPGAAMIFVGALYSPKLEASDNGKNWRSVVELETAQSTATFAFAPVTARFFRVEFAPRKGLGLQLGEAAPGLAMDTAIFANMSKAFASRPLTIGDLRLSGDARVDRFETKAGFAVAQDYYAFTNPSDGARGVAPGNVIDLTSKVAADGTLNWTPPKGNWRVLRLGYSLLGTTNHPAPPEATGLEVDKFDGAAVKRYLDHYLGMYRDASGGLIGRRGVQGLLTDSIEVGAANWTPKMIEQFKRLRGYDPVPYFPALTGTLIGSREDSDRFLYDYRRTLADLMASEHYGVVAEVAHAAGMKVYGEALEDKRPSLGDDMAMRRHADIPMAAMWTHSRKDGPKLTYLADIKGAASVAHIYGQNLVAAESMTASMNPWYYAPNDLKRIMDLEFVTGVNRPVVHTSVHVPVDGKKPGLSLFIFGQYFNRNESWAEMAKPWVDNMARNAYMLQQGRYAADVAYFFGEEAPLTGLYGDKEVADAPRHYGYDFVNPDVVTNMLSVEGGDLVAKSGARYKLLYLGGSSSRMTVPMLRRLAVLAESGATIVGQAPTGTPSQGDDPAEFKALVGKLWGGGTGKGRVIAGSDVEAALATLGVKADFRYTGGSTDSDIPFLHRKLADGDSYFLVNRKDQPEKIEARFRVTGKVPELWHAETGKSEAVSYRIAGGETIVPLALAAEESVHVVFRKPATSDALTVAPVAPVALATLGGPWTVAFQPDRSAPASTVMRKLAPLNEHSDPGIKYFSGEATYTTQFATPRNWRVGQPLWLDLGEVKELAEVTVNGKNVGSVWHAPFRLDIGGTLQVGNNKLEIKVANLWVNRLIGDAQPGAKKITFTAMPTYRADAPLRPSGLIGPVTLSTTGK